jgi:predicted TIM-barrel fold metal-dependent hydrolase
MEVIDLEHHLYAPNFYEECSMRTEVPYFDKNSFVITWYDDGDTKLECPQKQLADRLIGINELRIREMDAFDIKLAAISSAPGVETMSGEQALRVAREYNDYVAAMSKVYPGRFVGMACLPVDNVDVAIEELNRCVSEYGFVGWHTHSNFGINGYIDDEKYKPLLKEVARLGVYVYIHPTVPLMKRFHRYGYSFSGAGLGFTIDVMTTTAALICSGAFDENEGLQVVIGHL